MKKTLGVLIAAGAVLGLGATSAQAASSYNENSGIATVTNDGGAGASYEIQGSTVPAANGDVLSFEYRSADVACGGGAPRVFIQAGAYNSFDSNPNQCGTDTDGDGWFTVTGTIAGITDGVAGHIGLVNDNPSDLGTIEFRNVTIDGVSLLPPSAKDGRDACKRGGWESGGHRNQGQCVSAAARDK